jgi:hypothetical protein
LGFFTKIWQASLGFSHLVKKDKTGTAFDGIQGDLEGLKRDLVGDGLVGQDKGAHAVVAVTVGHDDLVKVRGDGHIGWVANHLVFDIKLAIGLLTREIEGSCEDIDVREGFGELSTEMLKMSPVYIIEGKFNTMFSSI